MFPRIVTLLLTALIWIAPAAATHAQQIEVTPTISTPEVIGTATPDMVVEVRPPAQPPQGFWEKYGIWALVISGVVGGILTLIFSNLLGPLFSQWGEQLRDWSKGESGRFLERYIPALAEDHRYLKLVGIYGKEQITRPPLQEVYVSLQMGDVRAEDADILGQPLSMVQALQGHDRLLILGEPGAGKSTLMDWLTLVFCGEVEQPILRAVGDLLPIYLPLRVCAGDERPLHDLMADPALLPLAANAPAGFFAERLDKGGCLVLLDGLDEVVDRRAFGDAADKINQLVRTYPRNHYVVTCRTAGWEEGLLTGDFTRLLIRNFSDADVHRFVTGWYRAVRTQQVLARAGLSDEGRRRALEEARRRAAREADSLIETLEINVSLSELARNPLILSLIALVHYRRYRLPEGRAKLYQECLEILLDVWDREDKEIDDGGLSLNAKETVLRQIAYHFHSHGLTEADADTLKNLIAPLLPGLDCRLSAAEVLDQIEERSGILVTRALDRYVFAHRTLQEYLTATVLAATPERFSSLLAHLHEEPWREVLLLYAGMVDDATELVRAILRAATDEQGEDETNLLALAGQCLVEDVRVDEAVRAGVLARLEAAFDAAQTPLAMQELGRTLAAIGGQDVVSVFERVLEGGGPAKQAGAARALGRLGARQKEREAIAALLVDRLAQGKAQVQRAAALALADLDWRSETVIAALETARQRDEEEARAAALWALLELGQAQRYGMIHVAAGEFEMGADENDPVAEDNEKPRHRLYLDDYYIARHPVTNAEFARFVESAGYAVRGSWEKYAGSGRDNHPAVGVTWHDAVAYAAWLGAHLPSEAQWEKAAGWDAEAGRQRRWPWGDLFEGRRCNTDVSRGASSRVTKLVRQLRPRHRGMPATTPVGRYSPDGDSAYGCADMAGNVWEWCSTRWGSDWDRPTYQYPYRPDDGREDLEADDLRILRGGSWYSTSEASVRCGYRSWNLPGEQGRRLRFSRRQGFSQIAP